MSWLDFVNHFLSNQRLHAWSWINRTSLGNGFFWWEFWLLSFFGLFLFCFGLTWGEQVTDAQVFFGWQSKGEDHFRLWFPFLLFVYLVTILYCSDIVWSKDLSAHFFCFLSILDRELSFLPFFAFSHSLIGNFPFFSFFAFSHSLIGNFPFFSFLAFSHSLIGNFPFFSFLAFSTLWLGIFLLFFPSEGKVWHFHPGSRFMVSQDFGSRLVEWLDMVHVRVWFGSRIKGMPHIISMTQKCKKWWFGNFMQNWSCMHLCGHSSFKFLWSCDARVQNSFPLFLVNPLFPKYVLLSICAFIRVHFGCSEKLSQHSPFKCIHIFSKTSYYLFSKACCFF